MASSVADQAPLNNVEEEQNALKTEAAEALERGESEEAFEKLTKAISLGCAGALLYSRRARIFLELGQAAAAIDDCTAALSQNADCGAAYKIRGKAHLELGKLDEARKDLAMGLKLDYDEETDEIAKALLQKSNGDDLSVTSTRIPPVEAFALRTAASQALEDGLPEVAIEKFTELIKLDCGNAHIYTRRAKLSMELGRLDAAVEDCTAALDLDPDFSLALKIRGKAFMQLDCRPRALTDLSRALELDYDEDTDATVNSLARTVAAERHALAQIVEAERLKAESLKNKESEVVVEETIEPPFPAMSPPMPGCLSDDAQDVQNALKADAIEAWEAGKLDFALEKFTEAIQLGCTSALLYSRRAKLLLQLARPRAAVNDCTAALELNPDSGPAHKTCGKALAKLEDWAKAHQHFSAGLKIDYDEETDEMAKLANEKLKTIEMQRTEQQQEHAKRKADADEQQRELKRRKDAADVEAQEAELDREWMRQMQAEIDEEEAERNSGWVRQKHDGVDEDTEPSAHVVEPEIIEEPDFPEMSPPVPEEGLTEEMQAAQNSLKAQAVEAAEDGDSDAALIKFSEAIKLGCTSALLYSRRAKLLLQMGRPRAAANDCSAALLLNPDSGTAFKIRGKAHLKLHKWEEGHRDLQAGLSIDYDEETEQLAKSALDNIKGLNEKKAKEQVRNELQYKSWIKQREMQCRQQREKLTQKEEREVTQERDRKKLKVMEVQAEEQTPCEENEPVMEEEDAPEEDKTRFSLGASLGLGISDMTDIVKRYGCVEDEDVKVIDPSGWPLEEKECFETFDETPFPATIKANLMMAGFSTPSQIQQYTWPLALQAHDVVGVAATGSGKTLAFLLPAFAYIIENGIQAGKPMLLVMAPTRELAIQIEEEAIKFGRSSGIRTTCCYGGAPKPPQAAAIRIGVHGVIGTPGRINDFLDSWQLDLSFVAKLVLDEADRMLDMGFEPQIRTIIARIPRKRHTLFFTATWPPSIRKLASEFLHNPYQVQIGNRSELKGNQHITQLLKLCRPANQKNEFLWTTLKDAGLAGPSVSPTAKGLIFCGTKKMCDQLAHCICRWGVPCSSIHGDRSQQEREACLSDLKAGKIRLLVATDVAARGLDIKGITLVVNYDVPKEAEYVHRIGRTGRAGRRGMAVTLLTDHDAQTIRPIIRVMRRTKQEVPKEVEHIARHVHAVMHGNHTWG